MQNFAPLLCNSAPLREILIARQAIEFFQSAINEDPGYAPAYVGLADCYNSLGRKPEATKILNELLELNKHRYVTPAALANVYIGLGDKDQTFVWLEKAYEERSNYLAYLKVFPIVDPLRSDPRFTDLIRRVGLPE